MHDTYIIKQNRTMKAITEFSKIINMRNKETRFRNCLLCPGSFP